MVRTLDYHILHSRVLYGGRELLIDNGAGLCKYLAGRGIHHILSQRVSLEAVLKMKLFIEFISSDFGQVIATRVKEHAV